MHISSSKVVASDYKDGYCDTISMQKEGNQYSIYKRVVDMQDRVSLDAGLIGARCKKGILT